MAAIEEGSDSNWKGMMKWWSLAAHPDGTHRPPVQTNPDGTHRPPVQTNLRNPDGTLRRPAKTNLREYDNAAYAAARVYQIGSFFTRNDPEDDEEGDVITPAMFEKLLGELQKYVGSVDIAKELHSANALIPLLYNVMYHKHAGVRAKAAEAVTTMVQNNPRSQRLVLDEGDGLPPLLYNISDSDVTVRAKALGAISALIRNNKPGITAFRLDRGYKKLWDALSIETESIMFQRDALNLIRYLLHKNSSDCNIVTKLGFPLIMMHRISNDDAEVREAALRVLLVLARDEGGNSGRLVKIVNSLKQVLEERIVEISAMAPEDLGAAREEIQLVDSLWNACYNEPSSLREKGLLEDAAEPVQHS